MAHFELISGKSREYSSQRGSSVSLFELGLMYCTGKEVPFNLVEAHKWFNLAAIKGNSEAKKYRQEISGEMSKKEISEAQRLAREWLARY